MEDDSDCLQLRVFLFGEISFCFVLRVEWRVEGLKEYRKRCNTGDSDRKRMQNTGVGYINWYHRIWMISDSEILL